MNRALSLHDLRSRHETAQINEALTKVLAHNLCVVIQSTYELNVTLNSGVRPHRPCYRVAKLKRRQVVICHRFGYTCLIYRINKIHPANLSSCRRLPNRSWKATIARIQLIPTLSMADVVSGLPPRRTTRDAGFPLSLTVARTLISVNCFASHISGCEK